MSMNNVRSVGLQICRLCLARTPVNFCLITNQEILEMLQSVTSLQIPADDNISTVICYKCKLNLKLAYKIQQNMLKAETRFYEQFQVKPEIIDEPIELNIPYELDNKVEISEVPVENKVKCDKCNKSYDTKVQLHRHISRIHATLDVPATCKICQKSFRTKDSLNSHMYMNHSASQGEQKCDVCNKIYPNIRRLHKHKLNHIRHVCKVCGKNVRDKVMKDHMATHGIVYKVKKPPKQSIKKEFNCKICDLTFTTRSRHFYHNNAVHKMLSKPLECPVCQKQFPNRMKLSDHKYIHKNTGPHTCDICGSTYISKMKLTKHKLTHVRVKCTICNEEVAKTHLPHHMLRHGEKQICDICGFQSTTKYNLKVHKLRMHGNPTPYKCKFCDKKFTSKTTKNNHEKNLHLGEKKVQCEQCGKKFFDNLSLKRHFNTKHLKIVKSFKCEFCEKEFTSGHALKTHKRIHTNETPFKCEICGDGFRQKVSLKTHLKSKHNVEEKLTEFCKECGKGFGSIIALQSHRRVHE